MSLDEWLSVAGLVLSVPPLVMFFFRLAGRIKRSSPRIALHEFALLVRQPWHVTLVVVLFGGVGYLIVRPASGFPESLVVLIPVLAALSLLASFFLAQSRQLSGEVILNEMRRLSRATRNQHGGLCTAVRFDIDRLKAISNYSPPVAERIRKVVDDVIAEEVDRLRRRGRDVVALDIPGEDETVIIAEGLSVEQAADFADEVRRRVKQGIGTIPYYAAAVALVVERMQPPSTVEEEREGIGTVSAGVAADRGLPEMLLSDVSAAVKESKTRGRNKTVIYRPGQAPEVRNDYVPQASKSDNQA